MTGGGLLAEDDGFRLADVRCPGGGHAFDPLEQTRRHALVFAYRGAFVRQADGATVLLDSTVAYVAAPDSEQRFAHPMGGDACLAIHLSPALLASLAGGDPCLTIPAVPMDVAGELAIRRLMTLARAGDPGGELAERVVRTVAALLARRVPDRVASGRPSAGAHERLTLQAREELLAEPSLGLVELGRRLNCSPHHLSRVFGQVTGTTMSAYRTRIRVSRALHRIAIGETNLSVLAHELGFADHAHLTRTVRKASGQTPTMLRAALSRSSA